MSKKQLRHVEVFYVNRNTGWAVVEVDDTYQGEAEYHYRKSDALRDAKQRGRGVLEVRQFNKEGSRIKNAQENTEPKYGVLVARFTAREVERGGCAIAVESQCGEQYILMAGDSSRGHALSDVKRGAKIHVVNKRHPLERTTPRQAVVATSWYVVTIDDLLLDKAYAAAGRCGY